MTNEEIFERQAETNLLAFEEEASAWMEEMKVLEEKLSRSRKEFLEGVDEQLNRLGAQAEQSLVAMQGITESAALLTSRLLAVEDMPMQFGLTETENGTSPRSIRLALILELLRQGVPGSECAGIAKPLESWILKAPRQ